MKIILLLLLILKLLVAHAHAEGPEGRIVRSPQGPVRGYKEDGDIFVFYNVPYATVPKGIHKFTAPYPPSAWLQTYDAVDKGIICPQAKVEGLFENKTMQEECLVANVFVPETDKKKLPVIVYVHGGGFQIGYSNWGTPKNLVKSKKVIAVTFNYRLGIHGFLCLGTDDVPGNAGMKDQVALLRWVRRNIASYGGDPDDVTIAGYSAGSVSVELLMLSKSTRDLFNKAILESGSSLSVFALQYNPLEIAQNHAKSLGFEKVDDIFALEDFYKTLPYEKLTSDGFLNKTDFTVAFSPCVERNTKEIPFLTESSYDIITKGKYRKLPLLYGFTDMEGLFRAPLFDSWKDLMNANFADFLPADLKFKTTEERDQVIKKIKQFYFDDKPINDESISSFIKYFSDVVFTFPALRALKLHAAAEHNKIYLYEYNYVDEDIALKIPGTDNLRGADHCAQTAAVLDGINFGSFIYPNYDESIISETYSKVKKYMRDIWLTFITTGHPVTPGSEIPDWPSADGTSSPYMSLGANIELKGKLLEERTRFWQEIYDTHYRNPIPPPAPPHTEL